VENEKKSYQKFEKETLELVNIELFFRNMWQYYDFYFWQLKTLGLFNISPRVPF